MEKCKLDDLMVDLREADRWLRSLGFPTRNDRFRQFIVVVEKAIEGIKTARRTGQPAKIGHVNSYHFDFSVGSRLPATWDWCRWTNLAETGGGAGYSAQSSRLAQPVRPSHDAARTQDPKVAMARRLAVALYWMSRKEWNYEQSKSSVRTRARSEQAMVCTRTPT